MYPKSKIDKYHLSTSSSASQAYGGGYSGGSGSGSGVGGGWIRKKPSSRRTVEGGGGDDENSVRKKRKCGICGEEGNYVFLSFTASFMCQDYFSLKNNFFNKNIFNFLKVTTEKVAQTIANRFLAS